MILNMYIALEQELTITWGRNFDINRNILSLRSFVASFKNVSLKSDFMYVFFFFFFFHDFISTVAGVDSTQGTKF